MDQNIKISIVIVSLNVKDVLETNLAGLLNQKTRHAFEIIVADNGSNDGTCAMIREKFPQVELIQNDSNIGFAYGCNQGMRVAHGEVILLFNPDMEILDGCLDYTYEKLMNDKTIGLLGVKLAKPDGTLVESVRHDPTFADQLAIALKLPHLFPKIIKHYLAKDFDYSQTQFVDQIRGSYMAFRREIIEQVGYLDDKNFPKVWFEDIDYCRRVRNAGFKILYSADFGCIDLLSKYMNTVPSRIKQARFAINRARYFKKWHGWAQALVFYILWPVAFLMGAIVDLANLKSKIWK